MDSLINYAIRYAEKGLYVLPMLNKRPLIKFADQPALTTDEIKSIWKKYPYAQIALRTVDFFVVDIDEHPDGGDGFKSFDKLPGELFPETLSQKTAGGGRQLFYLKRDDTPVQQNIGWHPGIDVKAHINNYVLAAPSMNHGKHYQWENHNPIVTAPKELIKAINKRDNSSNYQPGDLKFTGKRTTTTELFEEIVDGLGETGGRNNALTVFVGGLLFRNVSVNETYELAKLANSNTEHALPQKEFDRTFQSVVNKEIRRREEAGED